MNETAKALLLLIAIAMAGCSPEQSQKNYHASIEKRCSEQGFVPDTMPFKECFAKTLQRDMAREPGAKPYKRPKSWQHYME